VAEEQTAVEHRNDSGCVARTEESHAPWALLPRDQAGDSTASAGITGRSGQHVL